MTEKGIKRVRLIYGIVLSAALLVAAICLIVACVGVYRTGEKPYFSREEVAAAFAPIAIPVYGALALTVGGAFLHLFLPADGERLRAPSRPEVTLARLYRRVTLTEPELSLCKKEQSLRFALQLGGVLVCTGCTVAFLLYALRPHAFTDDVTGSVLRAMRVWLPCLAGHFVYGIGASLLIRHSFKRETEAVMHGITRQATEDKTPAASPAEVEKDTADVAVKQASGRFPVTAVRLALLAVGVFLLVYGFATGGIADVLTKAVNICTECIGLG